MHRFILFSSSSCTGLCCFHHRHAPVYVIFIIVMVVLSDDLLSREHGGRCAGIAEDEKAHSRMVTILSCAFAV
jgi:hypothetical protein